MESDTRRPTAIVRAGRATRQVTRPARPFPSSNSLLRRRGVGRRERVDEVLQQVERWGLDQHLKERGFEKLIPSAAA